MVKTIQCLTKGKEVLVILAGGVFHMLTVSNDPIKVGEFFTMKLILYCIIVGVYSTRLSTKDDSYGFLEKNSPS